MDKGKAGGAAATLRRHVANNVAAEAGKMVEAQVLAERKRCAGLMALSEQATRIGVNFDADAAIRSRISLQAARNKVMSAAAIAGAEETSSVHGARAVGEGDSASTVDKAAMWRKAYENNRPKPAKLPEF
ncbi:hypothetical protein B5K08_21820 [Rhizobium leguminosarum bv. trifolii]|uniref:Uncharacterized protein n=1 Tax=Rhizobium leguminosarum bv. trifolii TaxID=386 RepID=A0A3E1B9F2_RHILT|nr:hypothetical protein [Rhizobium leguminosarum]RFB87919.1 hypothetical protein B5K08_21820 [Rhizobium leguminosarum bv. trifolii]RFB88160.1 hypothetical protein B5K10_21815 [Rhizobium leguminosarum bv. trifolii]